MRKPIKRLQSGNVRGGFAEDFHLPAVESGKLPWHHRTTKSGRHLFRAKDDKYKLIRVDVSMECPFMEETGKTFPATSRGLTMGKLASRAQPWNQ